MAKEPSPLVFSPYHPDTLHVNTAVDDAYRVLESRESTHAIFPRKQKLSFKIGR